MDSLPSHNCSRLRGNVSFEILCSLESSTTYDPATNTSSNAYEADLRTQKVVSIIMELLFVTFFVAGVLGNVTVLHVVSKFSKLKSVTNFYIINLATSDLLFLLGIPFLVTTYIYEKWIFGNLMCKFYLVNTSLNQFTSSLFLTIMSADRYVAVCHPISSPRYRTPLISKLVATTAWMVAAIMIAPVFMYATTFQTPDSISCNIFWPTSLDVTGTHMFLFYSFLLSFAIPLVLIFSFYTLVIWKLKSSHNKSHIIDRRRPKRSKVTRLVMTLIAVYIFCWLPYWILQLVLIGEEPRMAHRRFMIICFHVSSFLTYANSAINPVLYTFLSENFKNSMKEACSCYQQLSYMPRNNSMNLIGKVDGINIKHSMLMKNLGKAEGNLRGGSIGENRRSASSQTCRQNTPRDDTFTERQSGSTLT